MPIPDPEELFHELLDLPPDSRVRRLEVLSRSDPRLHAEVASLLRAFDSAPEFLRPPEVPHATLPQRLGKYEVLGEIGRGAAGVVYLARDHELRREVAIKTLKHLSSRSDSAAKLREEARALASVVHPNLAQVYTIEQVQGDEPLAILTMEYVPGATLAERLAEGALSLEASLDVGRQVAAALEAAHQRGVVHRDLKPANIRTTPEGWVKVLDFGLAAFVPADPSLPAGAPSAGGTPGYMSPEQCRGERVTPRSDLFSFGTVLFELLTGQPAIPGDRLGDIIAANRAGAVDLDLLPSDTPETIVGLLRDCLQIDPDRRTLTAGAARHALEEQLLRLRVRELAGVSGAVETAGKTAGHRGNLPRPIAAFIGRGELLAAMRSRLPGEALVTLTGPGGVGKTRTSIEAAAGVADRFPGGCWFVDLSESAKGKEIPYAVARAMHIREIREGAGSDALESAVAGEFREGRGLLLLDNCEHLAQDAAEFVEHLMNRAAQVTVLATSRQPLGLPGEWVVPLSPLDLPEDDLNSPVGALAESIQLFLSRAGDRSRLPGEGALPVVADICRRLDGLPLAIELAARHTRALPLEEIQRRIAEGRNLSDPTARRPARHRSLRDLVDWSYRLLAPDEQTLLRRLSIFRGGCTLESAEAVCAGEGIEIWQVYELLLRLVERSLVEADGIGFETGPDPARPARYRLLETIRAFAAAMLHADEEESHRVESRFLDHMVGIAALRPGEQGPTSSIWVRRVEPDYANLLQGIDIAVARGRLDFAFRIAGKVSRYWVQAGYWAEGLQRLQGLLDLGGSGEIGVTQPDAIDRIEALNQAGRLAASVADHPRARALTDRALAEAREARDPLSLARALHSSGVAAWFRTEIETAKGLFEESLGLFEQCGDAAGRAVSIGNLGAVYSVQGMHEIALGHHQTFIDIARDLGDRLAVGKGLLNLARTEIMLGRPDKARAWLDEALEIHRQNGDAGSTAMTHHHLGELHLAQGRLDEARAHLLEAVRVRDRIGDRGGVASALTAFARVDHRAGRADRAARIISGILKIYASGSIASLPAQREMLQGVHASLAAELGPGATAVAVLAGESLDLQGLIALASGAEGEGGR